MLRTVISAIVLAAVLISAGCSGQAVSDGPKTTIVLQVDPQYKSALPQDPAQRTKVMEQARDVLVKRVAGLPVSEPSIALEGTDKIVVTLQNAKDAAKVLPMLTSTATLEFYHLKNVRTYNHPTANWSMTADYTIKGNSFLFTGPKGETIDSLTQPKELLAKVVDSKNNPPILTGANLKPNAQADLDQYDGTVIRVEFDNEGTRILREFTRKNKEEILAIFYDDQLLTAPVIKEVITSGKAQISGFKSIAEAKQVADSLNSGQMPVRLVVVNMNKP